MNDYNDLIIDNSYYNRHKGKNKKSNIFKAILLILVTSIISSSIVGGILYNRFTSEIQKISSSNKTNTLSAAPKAENTALQTSVTKISSVSDIAKKALPSIVGIRLTITNNFNPFMRSSQSSQQQSQVEGSGVIISKDGYILTNYHVVEYADTKNNSGTNTLLEVFLSDKRQFKAKFIGGDSQNDLAVIKIDADNLTVAELGDSSKISVGDTAVAIGNPLGLEFAGSVTQGIISALDRQVTTGDKTLSLIQTDAAINPGNSGGALLNSAGQVIGINTEKISQEGVEGLGFAIPINDAKPIAEQLIKYGYVKGRPLIGISGSVITESLSQQYNLPVGIYVTDVTTGGGAELAGIKKGDVIVKVAGTSIKDMNDLDTVKKKYKSGDSVDVVIVRDGRQMTVKLTFTEDK